MHPRVGSNVAKGRFLGSGMGKAVFLSKDDKHVLYCRGGVACARCLCWRVLWEDTTSPLEPDGK